MNIKNELRGEYKTYCEVNKKDEYSKACITAGEAFMQAIDDEKSFEEANKAMCEAEPGLTGFMASMIMQAAVRFHIRGEEIRVWWNEKNGVKSTEGIVNTALMDVDDNGNMSPVIENV